MICKSCGNYFSGTLTIDGVKHNLRKRKYCLICSPFKGHNTINLAETNIGIRKQRFCKHCGQPTRRTNIVYCDDCQAKGYHRRATKSLEEAKTSRVRRRILIETRGHRCESCQLGKWLDKPIVLELHHADGNSDNNSAENLQLLCPNCHSMTTTYRAGNMGNGSKRSSYRKKYYDNLS